MNDPLGLQGEQWLRFPLADHNMKSLGAFFPLHYSSLCFCAAVLVSCTWAAQIGGCYARSMEKTGVSALQALVAAEYLIRTHKMIEPWPHTFLQKPVQLTQCSFWSISL